MKQEYFWSITIEESFLSAGLWTISENNVVVLGSSGQIEWSDIDELPEKVDSALASAIENLPEDASDPHRTVFGVPAAWVKEGKIAKEHLDKIRIICSKLSLSPTGFVVLPEAIAHGVKIKEGSPFTGVIIGVSTGNIEVTLFRLGNLVGTVNVGRSVTLIEDVVEALRRFSTGDNVPTRWLVYGGDSNNLERTRQELVKADWAEADPALKFLHTPQIELVDEKETSAAVSIAGASEMGSISGLSEQSNVTPTDEISQEDLDFVIDQDIKDNLPAGDENREPVKAKKALLPSLSGISLIPKMSRLKIPFFGRKHSEMGSPSNGRKKIIAFLITFLLISAGLFVAWWRLAKAEVAIFLSPRTLGSSEIVILEEGLEASDPENMTFPAEIVSVEVTLEKTRPATGTATVGEKATGEVTIRNGTSSDIDLSAGTRLSTSGDLVFVLDSAVTVDGASSPTTPGEAVASVTASEIGEDYNLGEDVEFSVGNFPRSEVDALATESFSGGTSRQVTVVSQADISGLGEELTRDLEAAARTQLESEAGSARLVGESVEFEVTAESTNRETGDEANDVTLTMSMRASGILISREQIDELSQLILEEQVPQGFTFRRELVEVNFDFVSSIASGVWEFEANLTADIMPAINLDEIKDRIAGKTPSQVRNELSNVQGYASVEVRLMPPLPGVLGRIPLVKDNIIIEVAADR